MENRAPFTRAHVAYVGLTGLAASAALAWAFATRPDLLLGPVASHPGAFATFAALALVSRLLAFRIAGGVTFSLDTGVYVASLVTIGAGATALVVLFAMLSRGMLELAGREAVRKEHWPVPVAVAKLLFGPAVTALILVALGLAFGPAARFSASLGAPVWETAGVFAAATFALIVPQFAVVTASYRLNGLPWRRIAREIVGPGLLGEMAFTPIGFALALAYKDRDMRTLGALAVSYVIFNYVFKRMWESSRRARDRADELAVVEEAGRAAASTLDVGELGRRLGISILKTIEEAVGVVLTVVGEPGEPTRHFVRAADRSTKPDLTGHVAAFLHERYGLAPTEPAPAPATGEGEILATPLYGPDGTRRAFLSVVLRRGARIGVRERRILESLGRQASIAVENWRLYSMATEDGLTGLFVRRYVEARLFEEFDRSGRSGGSFCMMMIDVDNLKTINDVFGHAAGDTLLREVAAAIRESVRGMDVPGRWGGDEFAALLLDMKLEDGLTVARRLSESVRRHTFRVGAATYEPSVSIGVASHPENGASGPGELAAMADRALYAVKKSGHKGSVVAAADVPRRE